MAYPTANMVTSSLPGSGVFGNGQVQVFGNSGTFTVPPGVNNVRVRVWGGGGGTAGSGGGFAMKTIYNLAGSGLTSVGVTVGNGVLNGTAGTSSFGSFCSATGGTSTSTAGGAGVGGDINSSGGAGGPSNAGGGGVGSMWGNGGSSGDTSNPSGRSSASGGGQFSNSSGYSGGSGLTGVGGVFYTSASSPPPTSNAGVSIDFIGTGPGGAYGQPGWNGGGGGYNSSGGFPGGGGGGVSGYGAPGLVIVEY